MKSQMIYHHSVKQQLDFDEVYQQICHAWELKAEQLQQRRWEHVKHAPAHPPVRRH